jgi:hypothetical protein
MKILTLGNILDIVSISGKTLRNRACTDRSEGILDELLKESKEKLASQIKHG